MTGAFLYLSVRSSWNLYRLRLQRLRQPRYAIGTVAGALYFYMAVFRSWRGTVSAAAGPLAFVATHRAAVELAGSLILFVVAALAWVLPRSGRPALAFTRAEIQFLFPAPITRRQLIYYKLLRWAIATPVGSAIVTFFLRPSSLTNGWTFFVGISLFMTTVNMYLTGVALSRDRLEEESDVSPVRRWLPPAIVAIASIVLLATVIADWPQLSALHRPVEVSDELQRLAATTTAAAVLWPFRTLVRVPLATSAADFFAALPVAVALLVLSVVWIVRSDTAFEEAAAQRADKTADNPRRVMRATYRLRRPPFALALSGPAEIALLWKNLILLGRFPLRQTILRSLPLIVIAGIAVSTSAGETLATLIADLCGVAAMIIVLMGPHIARYDLRDDLAKLAILKTWPVRGAAIVRGELLAPLVVLSGSTAVCVLGATTLSPAGFFAFAYVGERWSGPLAVFLVAVGLISAQLVALNALAVTFPAWVRIGQTRASGLEMFGQRLLMMISLLLGLVVGALPAAVAAAIVASVFYFAFGSLPFLLPSAVVSAGLLLECYVATEIVGRVLDRTNVADVEAGE